MCILHLSKTWCLPSHLFLGVLHDKPRSWDCFLTITASVCCMLGIGGLEVILYLGGLWQNFSLITYPTNGNQCCQQYVMVIIMVIIYWAISILSPLHASLSFPFIASLEFSKISCPGTFMVAFEWQSWCLNLGSLTSENMLLIFP